MTAPDSGADELDRALDALDRVERYVADGQRAFEDSVDRQLALVFLWTNVGSVLRQYCRQLRLAPGTEPFAGPIKMRDKLIYGALADLRPDIVWDTCVHDAPTLRALLTELRAAL